MALRPDRHRAGVASGEGPPALARGRRPEHYLPGEVCDPIGKDWFWVEGDAPRPDEKLLEMLQLCRARGTNLLLDVPPDRHGRIPEPSVQALLRLRKNAGL